MEEIRIENDGKNFKFIVPLPSNDERCQFAVKSSTTVGELRSTIIEEDTPAINQLDIRTINGVRISHSAPLELLKEFSMTINEKQYRCTLIENDDLATMGSMRSSQDVRAGSEIREKRDAEFEEMKNEIERTMKTMERMKKTIERMKKMIEETDSKLEAEIKKNEERDSKWEEQMLKFAQSRLYFNLSIQRDSVFRINKKFGRRQFENTPEESTVSKEAAKSSKTPKISPLKSPDPGTEYGVTLDEEKIRRQFGLASGQLFNFLDKMNEAGNEVTHKFKKGPSSPLKRSYEQILEDAEYLSTKKPKVLENEFISEGGMPTLTDLHEMKKAYLC